MLPLGLLTAAQGHPMLVELKSGETLNGHLVSCDTWMNLTLKEVVQTSADGDKFWRLPEIYVRGSTIRQAEEDEEEHHRGENIGAIEEAEVCAEGDAVVGEEAAVLDAYAPNTLEFIADAGCHVASPCSRRYPPSRLYLRLTIRILNTSTEQRALNKTSYSQRAQAS
ncbi:Sm-like ribonucleoprotein [Lojkania enalia]|uniref:LSM complex subunit LSM4 n=1 Tax=Lojkania enalia TaxID=147567 RepID=A0A9P4KB24_9PLEO|nr:Sm-like ribonucleoprotein [Didymosphaeria enalia]